MSYLFKGNIFFYIAIGVSVMLLIWRVFFSKHFVSLTKTPVIKPFTSDFSGCKVISFAKLSTKGVHWKLVYTPRKTESQNLLAGLSEEITQLSSYDRKITERTQGTLLMMEDVTPKLTGESYAFANDIYRYEIHALKAVEPANDKYIRLSGILIFKDYQDNFLDRITFANIPIRYYEDLRVLEKWVIWLFALPTRREDLFGEVDKELL